MGKQKKTLLYIVAIVAVAYVAVCLTAFPHTQIVIVEVAMSVLMLALLCVSVLRHTVRTDDGEEKLSFTVIMASSILAAVQLLFGITAAASSDATFSVVVEVSAVLVLIQALFALRFMAPKKPRKKRGNDGEGPEQGAQNIEGVEDDDPKRKLTQAMGAIGGVASSDDGEGGLAALMGKGNASGPQAKLQSTIADLQQSMDKQSGQSDDQRIDKILDRLQRNE